LPQQDTCAHVFSAFHTIWSFHQPPSDYDRDYPMLRESIRAVKRVSDSMFPRAVSANSCTILSCINVLGFIVLARYAEALGFVGEHAYASFSVTIGLLTMLVTAALLVWSTVDHFLIEPTSNTALAVAINFGFLCGFMMV
jgi:hypothetical protein